MNNAPTFVELPHGLFTADGIWFHTTTEALREFAPGVVDTVGLNRLIAEATAWTRIPVHAAVWVLLVLLVLASPLQAALAAFVLYLFLAIWGPSLVRSGGARLVRLAGSPIVQGLAYVGVLSFLATGGRLGAAGVGLAGFILLRWGIVDRLVAPLVARAPGVHKTLPAPDRTLRNLIIQYALKSGAYTGEIEQMEARMLEIQHYRRKSRK